MGYAELCRARFQAVWRNLACWDRLGYVGLHAPFRAPSPSLQCTHEAAFAEADATPGAYCFVRVFETHHVGATAPLVPRDWFTGARDEFRAYNPENGCLELLRPPASR